MRKLSEQNQYISDGSPLSNRLPVNVSRTAEHGVRFKGGGAFLSFQYWRNGKKPTTVGHNFDIPGTILPDGKISAELLEVHGQEHGVQP